MWHGSPASLQERALGKTEARDHEDLVAENGFNSFSHHNLVHNPSLTPEAMIIPDATAAVDKKWKTLQKLPIMASDKSEEQKKKS